MAKTIDLDLADWAAKHCDNVHDAIAELDRQQMEAITAAPFIIVTNDTQRPDRTAEE